MPITVVAGGQFGSEGKGKVAHHIARQEECTAAIRVGGPNSGHTAIRDGRTYRLRTLPTASLLPDVDVILPAGALISIDLLMEEITTTGIDPHRVHVDANAGLVLPGMRTEEQEALNLVKIGSTLSGTGVAVAERIGRDAFPLASSSEPLKEFLADTKALMRSKLDRGDRILVEGTQGYGLSLYHSPFYPFVTSRDTTAAGFLAEAGLSPLDVDDVVLALRAFPIRVAGPSGPLTNETTWEYITHLGGHANLIQEYTTVTNALRRVATFDPTIVNQAIASNNPTRIVLNHLDYFDKEAHATRARSARVIEHLEAISSSLSTPVTHIGLGPAHVEKA